MSKPYPTIVFTMNYVTPSGVLPFDADSVSGYNNQLTSWLATSGISGNVEVGNSGTFTLYGTEALYVKKMVDQGVISATYDYNPFVPNSYTSYALTGASANGIITGPDNNLWITDYYGAVWKLDLAGNATSYSLTGLNPLGIAVGPDGNIWVSDLTGHVCKVTTGGTVTTYNLSGPQASRIVFGPDGNFWGVEDSDVGKIVKITTSGVATQYTISDTLLGAITVGHDGNLWVGDNSGGIWKSTTSGVATQYQISDNNSNFGPLVSDRNGRIWAMDTGSNRLWYIDSDGKAGSYDMSAYRMGYMTLGPDNCLWISPLQENYLLRVTLDGKITKYVVPNSPSRIIGFGITVGPDNNIWFADANSTVWRVAQSS